MLGRPRPTTAVGGSGQRFGIHRTGSVLRRHGDWSRGRGVADHGARGLGPIVLGLATGDQPTATQYVGLLVALVGVVLASGPELSGDTGAKPVLLAIAATVLFGICLVAIAMGSRTSAVMTMTGMRASTVTILGLVGLAALLQGKRTRIRSGRHLGLLGAIGVLDVCANLFYGLATTTGVLSLVSVLGSLYPVVTVLLAWRFLGERLKGIQYLGVVMALGGSRRSLREHATIRG